MVKWWHLYALIPCILSLSLFFASDTWHVLFYCLTNTGCTCRLIFCWPIMRKVTPSQKKWRQENKKTSSKWSKRKLLGLKTQSVVPVGSHGRACADPAAACQKPSRPRPETWAPWELHHTMEAKTGGLEDQPPTFTTQSFTEKSGYPTYMHTHIIYIYMYM